MNEALREKALSSTGPFYFFDLDVFRDNIRRIREMTDVAGLCFAMKCNPFLVKEASALVDRIEVCSYGEYCICRQAGVDPGKLLISGVLKKPLELGRIVEECGAKARYTVESIDQLKLLIDLAERENERLCIYIRLSSGNQFGLDQDGVRQAIRIAAGSQSIELVGIHYYSGSQKRKPEKPVREIEKLDKFIRELEQEAGIRIGEIEYGPGIPARYFMDQKEDLSDRFFTEIREAISRMEWKGHITLEMGRIFAASCGSYVTRVLDTKRSGGINYAITDGGMHQLNYDGQLRGMYHPFIEVIRKDDSASVPEGEETKRWTICGCLCTVNDVISGEAATGPLSVGDLLVFGNAGAYSCVEGMALFLSHELPEIISYSRDQGIMVLRKSKECYCFNTASQEMF